MKRRRPICPRVHEHTTMPEDYVERAEWAEKKGETHRQVKCPGCGLFAIWARENCEACGVKLPADRLEVAREEEATGTDRGSALAQRLRGERCLKCSEPGATQLGRPLSGERARPEAQARGLGRTRS